MTNDTIFNNPNIEFKDCFWGSNGFEELKKYMRHGNDFCRDLASVLTERAENEINYSKGLNKTSLRLQKLSKNFHGNLSEAWLQVSIQMDTEAEMHKAFASALLEEIIKPLKILTENQNKCRKPVELRVEKAIKYLNDKKTEDFKMESQIIKTKEYLEKSESKFHKACSSVELARQDWQLEMIKGCKQMQSIEADRISSLEQLIKKLTIQLNLLATKMHKVVDVFQNIQIDIDSDLKLACKKHGTAPNEKELYLYDLYAENTKNMMNKDRRVANLSKWVEILKNDVESQVKCKQGLEKVKNFAKENPKFNSNNDLDVVIKYESVDLLQILYEASLFKLQSSLAQLLDSNSPPINNKYANLMTVTYDRQGVPITTLKLGVQEPSGTQYFVSTNKPSAPILSHSSSTYSISSQQSTYMPMPMPINFYYSTNEPTHSIDPSSSSSSSISTVYSISPAYTPQSPSQKQLSSSTSMMNISNRTSTINLNSIQSSTIGSMNNRETSITHYDHQPEYVEVNTEVHTLKRNSNILNKNCSSPDNSSIGSIYNNIDKDNKIVNENYYSNSQNSDEEYEYEEKKIQFKATRTKCIAQYDYKAARDDELNIFNGDVIDIIEKRDDGWWRGQLANSIGLFPSTFVTEIK